MTKINIILLGESGVGKTTLLLRFQSGEFKGKDSVKPTIGAEFQISKKLILEGNEINLFIWDMSGEERHRSVVRSYYRQGEGVLLVYDVTNHESFLKLSGWLGELRNINEKAEVLIAGNKNDDPSKKAVAVSAVKNFARDENLEYMEMSAMSGKNVEEAFLHLAKKILIAKGILTEEPCQTESKCAANSTEESRQAESKSKISAKPTSINKVPDNDVIRLEDTPLNKTEQKTGCC